MGETIELAKHQGETHNAIDIASLEHPVIAIVVFRKERERANIDPTYRPVHYQVTLDATRLSPSREYLRCGNTTGDEINGWQPLAELEVVEILAEIEIDGAEAGTVPQLDCLRNRTLKMGNPHAVESSTDPALPRRSA